jgi:hypothetical protein
MSYSYNTWYEQAYIPCAQNNMDAVAESGNGQMNVDGKVIMGGKAVGDKCYTNSHLVPGAKTIIYAGGQVTPYSITGNATADNVFTVRALRASRS